MNEQRLLSWSALLAHWSDFAKSALALPTEGEGGRLRGAVPGIIALQSVTHALAELDQLPRDEYALGQDRAEVLIRRHTSELHELWRGTDVPAEIRDLIADATVALRATREGGVEWCVAADVLVTEHPAELVSALLEAGFGGELFLAAPGVPLFRGCPAAFAREGSGATPPDDIVAAIGEFLGDVTEPVRRATMRQAYRQLDFGLGRAVRDLVVSMEALPGGQPLLVAAISSGEAQAVPLPMRRPVQTEPLPVEFGPG